MKYEAITLPANAALVLVDLQEGFAPSYWEHWAGPGGSRNNPHAEETAARVLGGWRETERPVIHVRHDSVSPRSPLRPGKPGNRIAEPVLPIEGEAVYAKHVNSAFIGTELERDLRDRGIDTLVLGGIQTDHCVSTTVRMAGNLGFTAFVLADASATFDRRGLDGAFYPADLMHATALASLHEEFATVVSASEVCRAIGCP